MIFMIWSDLQDWQRQMIERSALARTRERMEKIFRRALERPFEARLVPGFGQVAPGTFEFNMARASIRRLTVDIGAEEQNDLFAKQEQLIEQRREAIEEALGEQGRLANRLNLTISRERIVADSCNALFHASTFDVVAENALHVAFDQEYGDDQGGVTRDWFDSLATALQIGVTRDWSEGKDADLTTGESPMFSTLQDGSVAPRPVAAGASSQDQEESYRQFFAIGKFLAIAVLYPQPLPLSFNLVFCKHLLKMPVDMFDLRRFDIDFYRQRVKRVLDPGGLEFMESVLGEKLTFMSAPTEVKPDPSELMPGGRFIEVTDYNKEEYVRLLSEEFLCGSYRQELSCLLRGFWEILPLEDLRRLRIAPRELALMISGVVDVDPQAWKEHSECAGPEEVVAWFWEVVTEFTSEERCKLLHFATGSSRLPPGGIASLDPPFQVSVNSGEDVNHLPQAHTCNNLLKFPKYTSKEMLKSKLVQAIKTEGFGFA